MSSSGLEDKTTGHAIGLAYLSDIGTGVQSIVFGSNTPATGAITFSGSVTQTGNSFNFTGGGGSGGQVNSVQSGKNIIVNSTDPINPVVSVDISTAVSTDVGGGIVFTDASIPANPLATKSGYDILPNYTLSYDGGTNTLFGALQASNIDSTNLYVSGTLVDKNLLGGTNGQVLTTTGTGIEWATISGGGGVTSIVAGSNIDVDSTDPANPIVKCIDNPDFSGKVFATDGFDDKAGATMLNGNIVADTITGVDSVSNGSLTIALGSITGAVDINLTGTLIGQALNGSSVDASSGLIKTLGTIECGTLDDTAGVIITGGNITAYSVQGTSVSDGAGASMTGGVISTTGVVQSTATYISGVGLFDANNATGEGTANSILQSLGAFQGYKWVDNPTLSGTLTLSGAGITNILNLTGANSGITIAGGSGINALRAMNGNIVASNGSVSGVSGSFGSIILSGTTATTLNLTGTNGGITIAGGVGQNVLIINNGNIVVSNGTISATTISTTSGNITSGGNISARSINDTLNATGVGLSGYILQTMGGASTGYKWIAPPSSIGSGLSSTPTLTSSLTTLSWTSLPSFTLGSGLAKVGGTLNFTITATITTANNQLTISVFGGSTGTTIINGATGQITSIPVGLIGGNGFSVPFMGYSSTTGTQQIVVKIQGNSATSVATLQTSSQILVSYNS